jgi:hypothetical protein
LRFFDETLPIINKPKHPKKGGNTRNKMERPTSKKTKEPPKRVNHTGNIKFFSFEEQSFFFNFLMEMR